LTTIDSNRGNEGSQGGHLFLISNFRRDLNIVYVLLGSETSANYNLTPGKYPKEHIQWSFIPVGLHVRYLYSLYDFNQI